MCDSVPTDTNPLDELFRDVAAYRSGAEYREVMDFVARFRSLGPYNAALVQIQRPGASFALRAAEWAKQYRRRISPDARPMMILKPFGPIDFVFDLSDTEGTPVPEGVLNPFHALGDVTTTGILEFTDKLLAVGVRCVFTRTGSELAGRITRLRVPEIINRRGRKPHNIRFVLELNQSHSPTTTFATITHELGHMFCGHLGSVKSTRVPDRSALTHASMEFEAESVSWLLSRRLNIDVPSARYLAEHLGNPDSIQQRSEHQIFRATGRIEELVKGGLDALGTMVRAPEMTLFEASA